jgi:hypothetical protein
MPVPAAFDIASIGVTEPRRGAHDAIFEDAADAVGGLVQGRQLVLGELRRLAEHRVGDFSRVVGKGAERIEHEAHIGERRGVGHRHFPADCSGSIADRWRPGIAL